MEATVTATNIHVRPLSPAVGAEVTGADLAQLDDAAFRAIEAAWLKHSALLFRGQRLTHADLIAFSRRFGELDEAPINENGKKFVDGYPEIYVVSNIKGADGQPIGSLGAGEAVWHTDMSYLPLPPEASMLYSVEVPPAGGDTWLCGLIAACAALPADLKHAVAGRSIKHDGTYNSGGFLRAGVKPTDNPMLAPGTLHPAVTRIPETGDAVLYLGRRRMSYISGLSLEGSEALLDELWAYPAAAHRIYKHQWQVGDLVLWDNRTTMHRRDPFPPSERRIMHRTQIKGVAAPAAFRV